MMISIHALLAESDNGSTRQTYQLNEFLSTLSLRRATRVSETLVPRQYQFLSTLSLRRATTGKSQSSRAGIYFYPRSPCGERRDPEANNQTGRQISIHALLAESDHPSLFGTAQRTYFYPRSPCGERHHILDDISGATGHFYPRSPCGERHLS